MFRTRKGDCMFLTQEYRLKEFSVILQQQFTSILMPQGKQYAV